MVLNSQDQVSVMAARSDENELGWGLKIGRSAAEYHLVFWGPERGAPAAALLHACLSGAVDKFRTRSTLKGRGRKG